MGCSLKTPLLFSILVTIFLLADLKVSHWNPGMFLSIPTAEPLLTNFLMQQVCAGLSVIMAIQYAVVFLFPLCLEHHCYITPCFPRYL
ncbi:hypothetical protein FKM82_017985 [Ascaphus truei]